jgi:hypothetical protein
MNVDYGQIIAVPVFHDVGIGRDNVIMDRHSASATGGEIYLHAGLDNRPIITFGRFSLAG